MVLGDQGLLAEAEAGKHAVEGARQAAGLVITIDVRFGLKITGSSKLRGQLHTVEGITATFSSATSIIPIGKSTALTFKLTDTATGQPVADLEQYLGAYGHLMIIHQDGQTVVHSHPAEDEAGLAASRKGNVAFNARFPKPGVYKAWGQFQRSGKVVTIPFVVKIGGAK